MKKFILNEFYACLFGMGLGFVVGYFILHLPFNEVFLSSLKGAGICTASGFLVFGAMHSVNYFIQKNQSQ